MSRSAPPRFLIEPSAVQAGVAFLRGAELHHLRVRRLRPGDRVQLFDAAGASYEGRIQELGADVAAVEIGAPSSRNPESALRLILACAAIKGPRGDLVVEKATELGVSEFVVLTSKRTVVRPGTERLERWARIAASASKQSGRVRVPPVTGPLSISELAIRLRAGESPAPRESKSDAGRGTVRALCFHPGAPRLSTATLALPFDALIAVTGPEGGFEEAEVELLADAGCTVTSLGPRVLRAETAALAAIVLAQHYWGDL